MIEATIVAWKQLVSHLKHLIKQHTKPVLATCLIREVGWSGCFFGHDNARECGQASDHVQEKRTIPAHRPAHRDGFIAGTGATGVESAGGI